MRSVLTDGSGQIRTAYVGSPPTDRDWITVSDDNYIHPRNTPDGYLPTYYLSAESSRSFDTETGTMGVVYDAIIDIDAPDTIPNDGSKAKVAFIDRTGDGQGATISIEGLTETVTISGEYTETVTTTASAGTEITVSVSGDGIVSEDTTIEVVEP